MSCVLHNFLHIRDRLHACSRKAKVSDTCICKDSLTTPSKTINTQALSVCGKKRAWSGNACACAKYNHLLVTLYATVNYY